MRGFSFFASLVGIAACGSSTGAPNPVGTYSLVAVHGSPLPANIGLNNVMVSGSFTLQASGYAVITDRDSLVGNPSTIAQSSGGTWSINGAVLAFTDTSRGGLPVAYTIAPRTITSADGWVYQR